jgi:hypothetical protein
MKTRQDRMDANVIRLFHLLQGVSFVPFLSAAASPALLAQTPRPGLLQTVATWRATTILAVFGQLVPQGLDEYRLRCYSLLQLPYLLLQRQYNRYQGFFVQFRKLITINLKW